MDTMNRTEPCSEHFLCTPSDRETVRTVAFRNDSKLLACGCDDGTVRIWNLNPLRLEMIFFGHEGPVTGLAFSLDGAVLFSAGGHFIKYWSVGTGLQLAQFSGHSGQISSLSLSPDGKILASGSSDRTVRLWDIAAGKVLQVLEGHRGAVNSVAFSPSGRQLASSGVDASVRIWDVESGEEIRCLKGHVDSITAVSFSSDGEILASCGLDGEIRLWKIATGKNIRCIKAHEEAALTLAFSPDGKIIASGGAEHTHSVDADKEDEEGVETGEEDENEDGEMPCRFWDYNDWRNSHVIQLWNLNTGKCVDSLYGSEGFITCLSFSPDGRYLFSSGEGQSFILYPQAGQERLYGRFPENIFNTLATRQRGRTAEQNSINLVATRSKEKLMKMSHTEKSQSGFAEQASYDPELLENRSKLFL